MPKQNIGHDLDVTVSVGAQVVKSFGLHISTHFKPQWSDNRITPTNYSGRTFARAIFKGHEVEIMFARVNGVADSIAQYLEDLYKGGFPDVSISMLRTTRNPDGTVDQYRYVDGTMRPMDDGDWKGTDEVNMTFSFFFPERQLVSTTGTNTLSGQTLSVPGA